MTYIVFIFLAVIIILSALFLWFLVWVVIIGDLRGAPFVASRPEKIRLMCDLAEVRPGLRVIDLGSGDGAILLEAARRGAYATGIELNPFLVWYSRLRARRTGIGSRVNVLRQNFYFGPLDKADVIFVYLWPETMEKLGEKFLRECKPGARIVSNAFPIKGWHAIMEKDNVYLYEIPNSSNF